MTAFCADCDQTGFRFDAASNTAFPCDCRANVLRLRRARKMMRSLPPRYASVALEREPLCSLDEPVRQRIGAYVREIDARVEAGRGLWLGGERGTGKTSAAALLVKEASARGYAAGFHPLVELLGSVRHSYNPSAPGDVGDFAPDREAELIDGLADLDLLVLDDVGAARATPWVLQQLYVIVNRRYNDQRATVVTSHLDREQLAAVLGWGIVSRLVEMTGRPVLFGGTDRRLEGEAA
jgi:DNA replication protein DnaC